MTSEKSKKTYKTLEEAKVLNKTSRDIFNDFNDGTILPECALMAEGIYYDMLQHYMMLADSNRMLNYKKGIFEGGKMKGKVVLDAGSGFGILALWCAQAGAKKVYAVEITDNYKHIIEAARVNGLSDVIEVFHEDALKIDIPEKVDYVISEVIGNGIICEGYFNFICSVRDKYLKEGGDVMPSSGNLYISAIVDPDLFGRMESFFQNFKAIYGVKMSHLIPRVSESLSCRAFQKVVRKNYLKTEPSKFYTIDFNTMTHAEADSVSGNFDLELVSDGDVHGFSIWFDVLFPNGAILDSSPLSQSTHWRSIICYFKEPKKMTEGQKITGKATLTNVESHPFFIRVDLEYKIDNGALEYNSYVLGFDRGQLVVPPNFEIDPN